MDACGEKLRLPFASLPAVSRMNSKSSLFASHELAFPLVLGGVIWLAIILYWQHVGFSIFDRGDVYTYMDWSYHLNRHADACHMPGYPALLLVGRLVTLHLMPDTFVAQCLGLLTWVCGLFLARAVLARIASDTIRVGLMVFGLFPLLGVWSAADPVADLLAYAVALAALLFALENRFGAFACATGAGLMVHQAFYSFNAFLGAACVAKGMRWRYLLLCGVPFTAYYLFIAAQRGDINWIMSYHLDVILLPRDVGQFPVFDGLVGTVLQGGARYAVKAALVDLSFAVAIVLSIDCIRRRNWVLLSCCVPVVLAGILAPRSQAWVIFRLSKLLVFPACWWLNGHARLLRTLDRTPVYLTVALVLAISQFAWAHYDVIYTRPEIISLVR